MKYIGQTRLPHGIVYHYTCTNGNIQSFFVEDKDASSGMA